MGMAGGHGFGKLPALRWTWRSLVAIAVSEIKIHFKYPDGADSGMEIWPTAVTVDQVIRRVTAEIRIRDKNLATDHMACTDHRAWGLSAPGRGLLDRSTLLGDIGLAPGTRLKVENQGDRLEKRKSFDEGLRSAVEIGWLEAEEATRLKGLAREASLDDSDLDEISTEFATTRDFVAAAIHGKAHEPPGITEYRKALRAVPRAPGVSVADSVKQTLGRLREDSRLPVSSHHELARQLKIPKKIAEDLLAVPPPREGGLDRYRVELDRLKSSWPETSRDLIALKKLRKTHDISPEDHHKLALMAGMPKIGRAHV